MKSKATLFFPGPNTLYIKTKGKKVRNICGKRGSYLCDEQ